MMKSIKMNQINKYVHKKLDTIKICQHKGFFYSQLIYEDMGSFTVVSRSAYLFGL
jgi:hypothetical protein